jgi:hypothetical protein
MCKRGERKHKDISFTPGCGLMEALLADVNCQLQVSTWRSYDLVTTDIAHWTHIEIWNAIFHKYGQLSHAHYKQKHILRKKRMPWRFECPRLQGREGRKGASRNISALGSQFILHPVPGTSLLTRFLASFSFSHFHSQVLCFRF